VPRFTRLRALTLNIHKGRTGGRRRFMLAELREAVRTAGADLVFLQEVLGASRADPVGRTGASQYEYLADQLWSDFAYGRNAANSGGHHGNAVLSRFPIQAWRNHDLSEPGHEPRGLLHCEIAVPGWPRLHALCVHLGLRQRHRDRQVGLITGVVSALPHREPVIVAGDFNDWRCRADHLLQRDAGLRSGFHAYEDGTPRTFPARFPLLRLDRIYLRALQARNASVLSAAPWPHLSDHLPLLAEVAP
jgi:endonuclease/exonuclease/phosphatase family metal-dependent hydrolase